MAPDREPGRHRERQEGWESGDCECVSSHALSVGNLAVTMETMQCPRAWCHGRWKGVPRAVFDGAGTAVVARCNRRTQVRAKCRVVVQLAADKWRSEGQLQPMEIAGGNVVRFYRVRPFSPIHFDVTCAVTATRPSCKHWLGVRVSCRSARATARGTRRGNP